MRAESRQCLLDARSAADEIVLLAQEDWTRNRLKWLAIERLLMVVGEAFVRIRTYEPSVLDRLTDAHKVIGMRNVLIHGYDALDEARIEDAVNLSLPKLIREIESLL